VKKAGRGSARLTANRLGRAQEATRRDSSKWRSIRKINSTATRESCYSSSRSFSMKCMGIFPRGQGSSKKLGVVNCDQRVDKHIKSQHEIAAIPQSRVRMLSWSLHGPRKCGASQVGTPSQECGSGCGPSGIPLSHGYNAITIMSNLLRYYSIIHQRHPLLSPQRAPPPSFRGGAGSQRGPGRDEGISFVDRRESFTPWTLRREVAHGGGLSRLSRVPCPAGNQGR
jgi:hypothetical protein